MKSAGATKVIPHAFGERAVLKLMYAALIRASQTWRRVVISEFELKQIDELRNELNNDFRERTVSNVQRVPPKKLQQTQDLTQGALRGQFRSPSSRMSFSPSGQRHYASPRLLITNES